MGSLEDAASRQMETLPLQRTFEKGIVVSVDTNTGLVTYAVDGVEHEALTISGFMPVSGQPVQIAVNGNDRLVLPPAGVDPSLYGTIQTGEGPIINPNPLENSVNLVGWDASFGVTTWQFDSNTESWASWGTEVTVTQDPATGQNENGGGGVVGSLKCVANKSGIVNVLSPIVTVLRDADLQTLASLWVRSGQAANEGMKVYLWINWYDSTGTTLEKQTLGPFLEGLNSTEWISADLSDFGPVNPASNKAQLQMGFTNVLKGDVFYIDNALLMAPTNTTLSLNDPEDTILDSFDRANSATSLNTGAPTTWTARSGTWGVSSNLAYLVTNAGGLTGGFNAVTTALPGGYPTRGDIVMQATFSSTGAAPPDTAGFVYRYSATNNFWKLEWDTTTGRWFLHKVVAGVATQVGVGPTGSGLDNGDIIRVETHGPWHRVWHNGTLIIEVSDSALSTNTEHGLLVGNQTTARWDNFSLAPISRAYVRPGYETSMKLTSIAAGICFARTPGDIVFSDLPAVRQGEYWVVQGYFKQDRANASNLYLCVITVYDENGIFLANDFGGGFGPGPDTDWRYMISAFEIKHSKAARIRVNVVMLAGAAGQNMYVSHFHLHKATVVTAPIVRTAASGPRMETLPTPTGPQIRMFKSDSLNVGFSRMFHGNDGIITATTDATGFIVFNHGLNTGEAPAAVLVTPRSPSSGANIFGQAIVDTVTATTARVRCVSVAGAALNAIGVTFHFVAIAPF